MDNLPDCHFDAAVNCKLGDTAIFSADQYCEATEKPAKVLIDTRILTPHVFEQVMMAYLSEKTKHPDKQAVIITNNGVTSGHKTMQTFQHCHTVGLRTKRCKIWHDPPAVLRDATALSSIFKGSLAGANAKIMLDTGSAANCISEQFCKGTKIKISPLQGSSQIQTATGQNENIAGKAVVSVQIQSYRTKLRLLVVPIVSDCDVTLGEPWHTTTKAVTQYDQDKLILVRVCKGRCMRKSVQQSTEPMEIDQKTETSAYS